MLNEQTQHKEWAADHRGIYFVEIPCLRESQCPQKHHLYYRLGGESQVQNQCIFSAV